MTQAEYSETASKSRSLHLTRRSHRANRGDCHRRHIRATVQPGADRGYERFSVGLLKDARDAGSIPCERSAREHAASAGIDVDEPPPKPERSA